MNIGLLLGIVLLCLVLANLVVRYRRRHESDLEKDDAYYAPASGRTAPPSNANWQGSSPDEWGDKLDSLSQEIKSVRAILEEDDDERLGQTLPLKDFSTLPSTKRKTEVLNYLHRHRGKTIKLHTQQGRIYMGRLVSLTANKVMVRFEKDNTVVGINLEDVTAIGVV